MAFSMLCTHSTLTCPDMAIVLDPNDHITPKGIITLEDVMEELLQEEIYDEDDFRRQEGTLTRPYTTRKYHRLEFALFAFNIALKVAIGAEWNLENTFNLGLFSIFHSTIPITPRSSFHPLSKKILQSW